MKLGSHWKTIDDKKNKHILKYVNKCNIEKKRRKGECQGLGAGEYFIF